MKLPFSKYHGTGNDFIIIDNRELKWEPGMDEVARLCNRRTGIGADGLMLLSGIPGLDFYMTYFNSDGNESTMCGNGGRCMILFAQSLALSGSEARFMAIDGEHIGKVVKKGFPDIIRLKMKDVRVDEFGEDHVFLDTGSPHYVVFARDVQHLDLIAEAKKIRLSDRFKNEGTNVDFVEVREDHLFVRSYERGVEDETLSCGTGVTASVLAFTLSSAVPGDFVDVETPGGKLKVYFQKHENTFTEIWLEGPAVKVFDGEMEL
jgi:diaminopimelate epimerase